MNSRYQSKELLKESTYHHDNIYRTPIFHCHQTLPFFCACARRLGCGMCGLCVDAVAASPCACD